MSDVSSFMHKLTASLIIELLLIYLLELLIYLIRPIILHLNSFISLVKILLILFDGLHRR
jgi:hypothetical protein